MYLNTIVVFGLGCLASALAGCSSNGLVHVTGEVTVDGSPLESGTISFCSSAGQKGTPSAAAVIEKGRYSAAVLPGRKRVEIRGYKKVGQKRVAGPESPLVDIVEEMLPEQYNSKSELTCEVTSSVTAHNFTLKK